MMHDVMSVKPCGKYISQTACKKIYLTTPELLNKYIEFLSNSKSCDNKYTVKSLLVAAATIDFRGLLLRPQIKGGHYLRAATNTKFPKNYVKMDYFCYFYPFFNLK